MAMFELCAGALINDKEIYTSAAKRRRRKVEKLRADLSRISVVVLMASQKQWLSSIEL